MELEIPKKMEMKSLLPAPRSLLPAHVLAFPLGAAIVTQLSKKRNVDSHYWSLCLVDTKLPCLGY
jgi:hypothetical protein